MSNYLVTGGLGFVGSHLTEELHNTGHEVTVLDNLSNGHLNNLSHLRNKITIYISNVEQIKSTLFDRKFDGIFHLATAPRSSSLINPLQDIETNCKGMISVLELAKKDNAKVVFTSNSGIYGSKDDTSSIDETSINNPTTPYDANKLVSEYYCKIYYKIYNVYSTIVRFATVYGERQQVNESLNWNSPRQVSKLMQRIGRSRHQQKSKSAKGMIVTNISDDEIEVYVSVNRMKRRSVKEQSMHSHSLDVLVHHLVGFCLESKKRMYKFLKYFQLLTNHIHSEISHSLILMIA